MDFIETFDVPSFFLADVENSVSRKICMLFTGREVRMEKSCARGLQYGPRPKPEGFTQDQGGIFFPIQTDLAR